MSSLRKKVVWDFKDLEQALRVRTPHTYDVDVKTFVVISFNEFKGRLVSWWQKGMNKKGLTKLGLVIAVAVTVVFLYVWFWIYHLFGKIEW